MRGESDDLYKKGVYILLGGAAAYLFGRYLFAALLPFLIALAFAVLMEPGILWCRRRLGFRRKFAAAALCTLLLLTVGLGSTLLAVRLAEEGAELLGRLPALLQGLPALLDRVNERYEGFCRACPAEVRDYLDQALRRFSQEGTGLVGEMSVALLSWASGWMGRLPEVVLFLFTTVMAVYFTTVGYPEILSFIRRQIPQGTQRRLAGVTDCLRSTFWQWLRAESILCLITFALLLAGFCWLRVDYALLTAVAVAVIDALPVLGTGTVLLPWSAYQLLLGSVPRGVALLALYAVILLVRSLMEPRLMAAQVGLPPLAALLAMYLGFRLFGIGGMLLFPVLLMFVKQLRDSGVVRGWR